MLINIVKRENLVRDMRQNIQRNCIAPAVQMDYLIDRVELPFQIYIRIPILMKINYKKNSSKIHIIVKSKE